MYSVVDEGYNVVLCSSIVKVLKLVEETGYCIKIDPQDEDFFSFSKTDLKDALKHDNEVFVIRKRKDEEWKYIIRKH